LDLIKPISGTQHVFSHEFSSNGDDGINGIDAAVPHSMKPESSRS